MGARPRVAHCRAAQCGRGRGLRSESPGEHPALRKNRALPSTAAHLKEQEHPKRSIRRIRKSSGTSKNPQLPHQPSSESPAAHPRTTPRRRAARRHQPRTQRDRLSLRVEDLGTPEAGLRHRNDPRRRGRLPLRAARRTTATGKPRPGLLCRADRQAAPKQTGYNW